MTFSSRGCCFHFQTVVTAGRAYTVLGVDPGTSWACSVSTTEVTEPWGTHPKPQSHSFLWSTIQTKPLSPSRTPS